MTRILWSPTGRQSLVDIAQYVVDESQSLEKCAGIEGGWRVHDGPFRQACFCCHAGDESRFGRIVSSCGEPIRTATALKPCFELARLPANKTSPWLGTASRLRLADGRA